MPGILRNTEVFRVPYKGLDLRKDKNERRGNNTKSLNEAKKQTKTSGHETMTRPEQRMKAHLEGWGLINITINFKAYKQTFVEGFM